jgi:UDP-N-acetyl-D-glucosamine dehydrogenase
VDKLKSKIENGSAVVGVIGLGYVGLPLLRAFHDGGLPVIGFDIDPAKIQALKAGRNYLKHLDEQFGEAFAKELAVSTRFDATADFSRLGECDAVISCVPTPLGKHLEPDLSYVEKTAEDIAATLRPGQLVVLESTTYPRTTREVMLPHFEAKGLTCGKDFFLAFSPEREGPGRKDHNTVTIPKLVGGIDPPSTVVAAALYRRAVRQVVEVSSAEVAESAKLLENIYRAVNIALVNEMKVVLAELGIDIWEVVEAAKTKPFGFQAFYPGPGLGGHCIPIDPFYLTWIARKHGLSTRFIELAGEINTAMPAYVVSRVADALNERGKPIKGSKITLLGMAYKKDVDDPRESPGFELMDLLLEKGAVVHYNDPHIPILPPMRRYPHLRMASQELTPDYLQAQDCLLIVTDHSAYDWSWIVAHSPLVVDTRNATRSVLAYRERIVKA